MTKNTQTFKEYMEMPTIMDFFGMFGALSDHGLNISTTAEEFLNHDHGYNDDPEYATQSLGEQLEFYGRYLQAKVKGFETLRDEGIEAILETTDDIGEFSFEQNGETVIGSWCVKGDVLYIMHGGDIDTTVADLASSKRHRKEANERHAIFWTKQKLEMELQSEAA